jgi:hypothetical protein
MKTPVQTRKPFVCPLLVAVLTIPGARIAKADTFKLVFDVQLDTLTNDVTGAITSVVPFHENGLTFYFNDTVVGHKVFLGGLEKRTLFQPPPQVPLFSPTPFTSSLLATNPGSSFDHISDTYLKEQFNPNTNEGASTLAIGDFDSFAGPDPANVTVQDFWFYNIYIAVNSPIDPSILGPNDVKFPTSQDLHEFLSKAPQNGYEVDFVESVGLYQNGNLTSGLTYSGLGTFKSATIVPEPASFSLLVIALAVLVAISLRRKIEFQ